MFGLLSQGVGLRPKPWAKFSRPVGPAGWFGTERDFFTASQQIVAPVPDLMCRKVVVDEDALPDDRPARLAAAIEGRAVTLPGKDLPWG
jgi:hypothetical protein